ncbi:hypothetical protein [Nonomuraea recticatena]|uniref:hypothetical protein n=1 Tax=Nonomuraea recticatena TaxID=46178 RepID=UPI0031F7E8A1
MVRPDGEWFGPAGVESGLAGVESGLAGVESGLAGVEWSGVPCESTGRWKSARSSMEPWPAVRPLPSPPPPSPVRRPSTSLSA